MPLKTKVSPSMTSLFNPPSNFVRRPLSDGLVGPVLPRVAGHRDAGEGVGTTRAHTSSYHSVDDRSYDKRQHAFETNQTSRQNPKTPRTNITEDNFLAASLQSQRSSQLKTTRRLEQCRVNQRRYREKKRAFKLNMQQSIDHLNQEIENCKRRRQELCFQGKSNKSPWRVVADVFHLIETCSESPWSLVNDEDKSTSSELKQILTSLENSFVLDVAMGSLNGVDKLLHQLQRYTQYFSDPQIHLTRVEELTPGIVTASAQLNVTVSEFTLRCVFPHLETSSRSKYDTQSSVGERLLGKILECNCSITLFVDKSSGRVARLGVNVDWVSALRKALGYVVDVSKVLHGAQLTFESVIGESTTSAGKVTLS